jgi:geranylgeranyl transferase type-1 subunit beta
MLGYSKYISQDLKDFIKSTEKYGGYGKAPGDYPDLLHTYMSLCGLSIIGSEELEELYVPLGITKRTFQHLLSLQTFKS